MSPEEEHRVRSNVRQNLKDHELVDALSDLTSRYPDLWGDYGSTMYRTHSNIEWALVVYNEIARMILESTGRAEDSSCA